MLKVTICKLQGVIWNCFNLKNLYRRNALLKNLKRFCIALEIPSGFLPPAVA